MTRITPVEERLWRHVDFTGSPLGCWIWIGYRKHAKLDYGLITMPGYGKNHCERAHRIAWQITNGPIPKGVNVLHKCDNPPCVNPSHLFLGTNADNIYDAISKGRASLSRPGEQNPPHRLTWQQVQEIREKHQRGSRRDFSSIALARKYGVTATHIRQIIKNRKWKQSGLAGSA